MFLLLDLFLDSSLLLIRLFLPLIDILGMIRFRLLLSDLSQLVLNGLQLLPQLVQPLLLLILLTQLGPELHAWHPKC